MKIIIAGGTGFLGGPLAEMYAEDGHDVRVLTRSLESGDTRHDPGTGVPGITRVGWNGRWQRRAMGGRRRRRGRRHQPFRRVAGREALVAEAKNDSGRAASWRHAAWPLAIAGGEDSAGGLRQRQRRRLLRTVRQASRSPRRDPAGSDFLAQLCADWEQEARKAERPGTRVVLLRTGIVLERSGGALPEMMRPFRFFVGGPIGSGRQYVSWIHRLDWIEIVRWIVQTPAVSGPVNATAPHPVTNRQLSRALGRAMHRPSLVPAPGFAVKIVVGEFAESILTGQRVLPARAQKDGYHFRYPEIEQAFRGIFGE